MGNSTEYVTCEGAGLDGRFVLRGQTFPYDPRLRPLPNSAPFDGIGSVSVGPASTEIVLTVNLGRNEWVLLNRLGQEILDSPAGTALAGFSDCVWRLKVNGVPSEFYGQLRDQIGTGLADRQIMMLVTEPMATIEAEVENTNVADTYLCLWTFQGWTIPLPGL